MIDSLEDVRIQKTKTKLVLAFSKMIDEMDIDDITVNELCCAAGIRRATFYKHFTDKLDFFSFLVNRLRDRFDYYIWGDATPRVNVDYFVAYAEKSIDFLSFYSEKVTKILSSTMVSTVIELVMTENYRATCERLIRGQQNGMKLYASAQTLAAVLTGTLVTAIITWLKSSNKIPKEQFTEELASTIRRILE